MHVAVRPPLSVLTVITAVPGAIAVTLPPWSTCAPAVLLEDHVRPLSVAFVGARVAVSWLVASGASVSVLLLSLTDVTGRESVATVTLVVAVILPSSLVTVILAVPALRPVTIPSSLTVAIA